jgi:hypothetical protein
MLIFYTHLIIVYVNTLYFILISTRTRNFVNGPMSDAHVDDIPKVSRSMGQTKRPKVYRSIGQREYRISKSIFPISEIDPKSDISS